jgi:hypothetical protein
VSALEAYRVLTTHKTREMNFTPNWPNLYISKVALPLLRSLDSVLRRSRFWETVVLLLLLLSIVDLLVAVSLHVRFTDLAFMEGILVFGSGAVIASGVGNMRRERWTTLSGDPQGHTEYLEDQRSKEDRDGIILMIIGAIIVALSIAANL